MKADKIMRICILGLILLVFAGAVASSAYGAPLADLANKLKGPKLKFFLINTIVAAIVLYFIQVAVLPDKEKEKEQKPFIIIVALIGAVLLAVNFGYDKYLWQIGMISNFMHGPVILNTAVVAAVIFIIKTIFLDKYIKEFMKNAGDEKYQNVGITLVIIFIAIWVSLAPFEGGKKSWENVVSENNGYPYIWTKTTVVNARLFLLGDDKCIRDITEEKKNAKIQTIGGKEVKVISRYVEEGARYCYTEKSKEELMHKQPFSEKGSVKKTEIQGYGVLRGVHLFVLILAIITLGLLFKRLNVGVEAAEGASKNIPWLLAAFVAAHMAHDGLDRGTAVYLAELVIGWMMVENMTKGAQKGWKWVLGGFGAFLTHFIFGKAFPDDVIQIPFFNELLGIGTTGQAMTTGWGWKSYAAIIFGVIAFLAWGYSKVVGKDKSGKTGWKRFSYDRLIDGLNIPPKVGRYIPGISKLFDTMNIKEITRKDEFPEAYLNNVHLLNTMMNLNLRLQVYGGKKGVVTATMHKYLDYIKNTLKKDSSNARSRRLYHFFMNGNRGIIWDENKYFKMDEADEGTPEERAKILSQRYKIGEVVNNSKIDKTTGNVLGYEGKNPTKVGEIGIDYELPEQSYFDESVGKLTVAPYGDQPGTLGGYKVTLNLFKYLIERINNDLISKQAWKENLEANKQTELINDINMQIFEKFYGGNEPGRGENGFKETIKLGGAFSENMDMVEGQFKKYAIRRTMNFRKLIILDQVLMCGEYYHTYKVARMDAEYEWWEWKVPDDSVVDYDDKISGIVLTNKVAGPFKVKELFIEKIDGFDTTWLPEVFYTHPIKSLNGVFCDDYNEIMTLFDMGYSEDKIRQMLKEIKEKDANVHQTYAQEYINYPTCIRKLKRVYITDSLAKVPESELKKVQAMDEFELIDDEGKKTIVKGLKVGHNKYEIDRNLVCDILPLSWTPTGMDQEWNSFIGDIEFGLYHPRSKTASDYISAIDKGNRKMRGIKKQEGIKPTQGDPTFDLEAMKNPGLIGFWGKKKYYEPTEEGINQFPYSPYPWISAYGISLYLEKFFRDRVREEEIREEFSRNYVWASGLFPSRFTRNVEKKEKK